jgi:hypothetical protein
MLVACLSILEGAPVEARRAPEKTLCHIEEGAAPGLVTLNPIQIAPPPDVRGPSWRTPLETRKEGVVGAAVVPRSGALIQIHL